MTELSGGSILTCIVIGSILMLYLVIISKQKCYILELGPKVIIIGMMVVIIRMFFPFNFFFTYSVYSKKYLTVFFDLFRIKILGPCNILDILLLTYIIGTVISLTLFLWKQYQFYHLIHIYPYCDSSRLQKIINTICSKYNKQCTVKVIMLHQIQSPCITGLIHPIILLPMIDFTEEELHYIFAHELKHYYHHDLWFKLICELMVCLYWWNPIAHQLKKQLNTTIEFSNDFALAKDMCEQNRLCYVECLIKIAKHAPSRSYVPALYFSTTPSSVLIQRANFILEKPNISRNKIFHYANILTLACLLFVSLFFVFEPEYPIPTKVEKSTIALEKNKTFFVKQKKLYMTYYNGKVVGTVQHIEDFKGYRIYKSLTEAKKHEKFKDALAFLLRDARQLC